MISLNLPDYDKRISGTREKPQIFDILRKKYVALTPEEWVRQHFVHYLIEHKGYPMGLMANEVLLQCGNKTLRADTVLYTRELQPKIIIEYKAPDVPITQKVLDQISIYNLLLKVDYLIISNGIDSYCYKIDYENKKSLLLPSIPDYPEL